VPTVIDAGRVLIGDDYDVDGEDIEIEIGPVQPVGFWDDPKWRNASYPMRRLLYEQSNGRCPHPWPQR
jgi:hypothetical protein